MNKYTVRKALKMAFQELTTSRVVVANQLLIDHKIESIIYKLATDSFEESVKGKKFKNPETGNMVLYKSLPEEEQEKIRSSYKGGDKGLEDFVKDKGERTKNINKVVKEMGSVSFKDKIKDGLKSFVNADDFSAFSDAIKKKDKAGMKKALPGMAKGVAKVVGTIAATALLGFGGAKVVPLLSKAITTKFMAGKAALAGYAKSDAMKELGGLQKDLAERGKGLSSYMNVLNKKIVPDLDKVINTGDLNDTAAWEKSIEAYKQKETMLKGVGYFQDNMMSTANKIQALSSKIDNMPAKEVATRAMKHFSQDVSSYVSKAGEGIKHISSDAAKSVSDSLHKSVAEGVKFIGTNGKKVDSAWHHLGDKATEIVGGAKAKAASIVGNAQLDSSNMYKTLETNLGHLATEAKKMGGDAFAELKEGAGKVVKKVGEEVASLNKMAHDESGKVYKYLASEGGKAKGLLEKDYGIVKDKLSSYADKVQGAYNERYGEHFAYSAADTKKITDITEKISALKKAGPVADLPEQMASLNEKLSAAHTAAKAAGHTTKVHSIMTDVYKGSVMAGTAKKIFNAVTGKGGEKNKTQKRAGEDKEMDEFSEDIQKFVMEEMSKLKDDEYLKQLMNG
jgi:hypothetical protein